MPGRAARVRPGRLTGLACLAFGALAAVTWNLPHATTAGPVYAALFICFGIPGVTLGERAARNLRFTI